MYDFCKGDPPVVGEVFRLTSAWPDYRAGRIVLVTARAKECVHLIDVNSPEWEYVWDLDAPPNWEKAFVAADLPAKVKKLATLNSELQEVAI